MVGKILFKHCGKNINIERGARFGNGKRVTIGNNSGMTNLIDSDREYPTNDHKAAQ